MPVKRDVAFAVQTRPQRPREVGSATRRTAANRSRGRNATRTRTRTNRRPHSGQQSSSRRPDKRSGNRRGSGQRASLTGRFSSGALLLRHLPGPSSSTPAVIQNGRRDSLRLHAARGLYDLRSRSEFKQGILLRRRQKVMKFARLYYY